MKNNIIVPTLVCLFFIIHIGSALSNDLADEDMKIIKMDTIIVRAKNKTDKQIIEKPGKSVVNLENYKSVSIAQNPGDIVKELVIMDYRGATDLVPDDDTLYMRGFSGKRFVTAVDGSTIRKTGGRRSSHIVDYALIPPFLIDTIDVMPGPHSALFSAKSIGGVVNFMTREPEAFESFKPDFALLTSFGSYGTQNHHFTLKGGAGNFVYDLGYQQYSTNGYLRNNKADISTFFSRISYLLPVNGYFSFTTSYTDADRQIPVNNDPDDAQSNWNNDYPIVSKASRFYDWQSPTIKMQSIIA
jgi:iron complex outermembrane receptor protein